MWFKYPKPTVVASSLRVLQSFRSYHGVPRKILQLFQSRSLITRQEHTSMLTISSILERSNARKLANKKEVKHTATSIRWWSPTQLLIGRSEACLWQSGRDADYSSVCGRMY